MPRRPPSAHADPLPDDLLTLRAAAAFAGRSADTLRRWRGTHGLRDYRDPADPTAPSTFSRSELLALLARVNAHRSPAGADYIDGVAIGSADPLPNPLPTRPATLPAPPALIQQLVDDLRADRVRLQAAVGLERERADAAAAALDAARRDALELGVRLARLETLLLSGKASALDAERAKLGERLGVKPRKRKGRG
jgi:hypothetical protein